MEEKELLHRIHSAFESMSPVLENVRKGFFNQQEPVIRENIDEFRRIIRSLTPQTVQVIAEKEKSDDDIRYISMLPSLQTMSLGLENLMHKMATKVKSKVLFSEKALTEVKELYKLMETLFRDSKDFIITKNPDLKRAVRELMIKINTIADEYALIHQQRLITGVCMPEASYIYLDMIDSFKRITRALVEFIEKV